MLLPRLLLLPKRRRPRKLPMLKPPKLQPLLLPQFRLKRLLLNLSWVVAT